MDIASYEERSDPESLRMERTEKDHTFIWRQSQNWQLTMCKIKYRNLYYMLFVIYIVPPKPTYRHINICGNTWDEDHFTSVCPTEQMDDTTCPVCKLRCSRKDVMLPHYRNKHGQQKYKEKRCGPTDRGIYTTTTDQLVPLHSLHRNITQLWPCCQRISINGSHVVQGYTWTSRKDNSR